MTVDSPPDISVSDTVQPTATLVNCGSTPFSLTLFCGLSENQPILTGASALAVSFRLDLARLHLSPILLSSRPSQIGRAVGRGHTRQCLPGPVCRSGTWSLTSISCLPKPTTWPSPASWGPVHTLGAGVQEGQIIRKSNLGAITQLLQKYKHRDGYMPTSGRGGTQQGWRIWEISWASRCPGTGRCVYLACASSLSIFPVLCQVHILIRSRNAIFPMTAYVCYLRHLNILMFTICPA